MSLKTAKAISTITIALIALVVILAATAMVNAEPIEGQTLETHLAKLNSNMQFIRWIGGLLVALVGIIGSLVVFIFMNTVGNLKGAIRLVDKKVDVALNKTDYIEKNFMSIATHDRLCPNITKHD